MSALGQKQTLEATGSCPLYPQKRTLALRVGYARRQTALLFDHPVGVQEKARGDWVADSLRRFQIDNEFKSRWLLDRDIGRHCTAQNFDGHVSAHPIHAGETGAITNEGAVLRAFGKLVYRRKAQLRDLRNKIRGIDGKHRRRQKVDCLHARGLDFLDRRNDVVALGDASN